MAADDGGYVYGQTMLHGSMDVSWVWAWTNGMQADGVAVEGHMAVGLRSTIGGSWKSESVYYGESAMGDEVSISAEIRWDYTWQHEYTSSYSDHFAHYGSFMAWTNSQASR
ncbi:MAG TPA: hypothetical protein VF584_06330 [Longimicrobium sp.]|jgi:hypothetical protein